MKIVVDTNLFVSSFIGGSLAIEVIDLWYTEKFTWLLSNSLFFELKDVLFRLIIKDTYMFKTEEIIYFLEDLAVHALLISPQAETPVTLELHSPDAKDDKVLKCAIAGEADYIVTENLKDLAIFNDHLQLGNTNIINTLKFVEILQSKA